MLCELRILTTAEQVVINTDTDLPATFKTTVLRVIGGGAKKAGFYQEIPLTGSKGDVYVAGGWTKAKSRPRKEKDRLFDLRVAFKTGTGTAESAYTDTKSVEWNEE